MTEPAAVVLDSASALDIAQLRHVRPRHWGRIVSATCLLVLLALLVHAFAIGQINWATVGVYLTWPTILAGLLNTIIMSVCAMALGIVLGVAAAVARMSPNPVLRSTAIGYAWLFRGTPVILQLLLWFNLALIFPVLGIPGLWSARAVTVITPFAAALLGLGLNEGAYVSEIVRAGLLSVDAGQYEAAKSIGMSHSLSLRRIILPQAMRVVVPPLGNQFITLVKTTSLASVIEYAELLHNAENIYYSNAKVMELLFVAAFWYLVVVTALSFGQAVLERRFARGIARAR
ncbi:amino acid ABC transporter permease [Acidisphaera sp. L21]|uniref:amino acid ABC transporter permease n=1 Tax=Acidisphaera sp. L21 TaxID=1641851 RepID=UPI001576920C|nr:amino acid ABC transporter permease [Acidisphaera sp. L21]